MLRNVWNRLYLSNKLVEDGTLRGCNSKHPGVRSVLKIDGTTIKSESVSISWLDTGNLNCGVVGSSSSAKMYKLVY